MVVAPKSVANSTMNAVRERIVVGRRKVCMMWFSRSMFSHQWGVTKTSLPCGFAVSCMANIAWQFVHRTKTRLHEENERFNFCHSCLFVIFPSFAIPVKNLKRHFSLKHSRWGWSILKKLKFECHSPASWQIFGQRQA